MIGSVIIDLDCVDSTNNYAATELLTKSPLEGTVYLAACQQAGRGLNQSVWESENGLNLTFSIVLYPGMLRVADQFLLSKAISLGLTDFLAGYVDGISIKWPNDIYILDRKVAGVLIETAVSSGRFSYAIIGIGLNINQQLFLSDAPNPVSLRNITGATYSLPEMLGQLCQKLDHRYRQVREGSLSQIDVEYEHLLYRNGNWANYRSGGECFVGRITGVDPFGQLMIEDQQGQKRSFDFKEVSFI